MNYEPNAVDWKVGDLVIHDADAKDSRMLMRVVGYDEHGLVKTRYIRHPYSGMSSIFHNDSKYLHDPARFGIKAGGD